MGALILGAEPADVVLGFFGAALGVEIDEAPQDFFIGEIGGPAAGCEDGLIKIVVELLEDADQSVLVDGFIFGGEGFTGTDLCEHVVHGGEGELGVLGLLAFTVGIELLTQGPDTVFLCFGGVREGDIVAAGATEFAIEGEGVAHIDDQDEGRAAVLNLIGG